MQVVTGATGFVGNALVRTLLARQGPAVRALVGPSGRTASLAGLAVETIEVDVRSSDSLVLAFRGAEVVYHTAGLVSIGTGGFERLRSTSVEGTRNVLRACRAVGVSRFVYTSSVHTLVEPPHGTVLDETFPVDPASVRRPYAQSKAEATRLVLAAAGEGLDTVVVYVDGAYDFVDVRDVAQGLVGAAAQGQRGEGYILAGHTVSVADLIRAIKDITGVAAPRWRLPFGWAHAASTLMPAYYWARRRQPLFTTYSLDVIASNGAMTSVKAQQELGFSPDPWHRRSGTPSTGARRRARSPARGL